MVGGLRRIRRVKVCSGGKLGPNGVQYLHSSDPQPELSIPARLRQLPTHLTPYSAQSRKRPAIFLYSKLAIGQALDALLVKQTPDPAWQSRMEDAIQFATQDAFLDTLRPVAGFRKSADVVVIYNMDGSSTERVTCYVSQDGGSLPSAASSFVPEFAQ